MCIEVWFICVLFSFPFYYQFQSYHNIILLLLLGKDVPLKESEMAKGEATKMVVQSVSENSEKRSPKPDRKEPKKISKRKTISAPLPKQDSAVNDFKILRRPPSARQSMAISVAHIGLPDQRNGKTQW